MHFKQCNSPEGALANCRYEQFEAEVAFLIDFGSNLGMYLSNSETELSDGDRWN
jgi:hypothetical protein